MMHIAWVNQFASFAGGCEQYIFQTAMLLRERGVRSTLFYDSVYRADPSFLNAFDAAYPLLEIGSKITEINATLIYLHQLRKDAQLIDLLRLQVPVVKFFHDNALFCLRGNKLSLLSDAPCLEKVPGCACYPFGISLRRSRDGTTFEWPTLRQLRRSQSLHMRLDAFVVGSQYMADIACANGFPKDRVSVTPLYAPGREYSRTPLPNRLLFIGSLLRGKGLDVLLRALPLTRSACTLHVMGQGRQASEYHKLAHQLGLQHRVSFLGQQTSEQCQKALQQATCLVHPVRSPEPFGLIGPEAMRSGVPVIASNIGACPEWLENGKTGFLVPPNDPAALALAIDSLCQDPSLVDEMGRTARRVYEERYRPEVHIDALLALFQKPIRRFTALGSPALEEHLQNISQEASLAIHAALPADERRAFLLLGGYGKGEGGVEMRNGVEHPHNNMDFLLISTPKSRQTPTQLKALCQKALRPLSLRENIAFDMSAVKEDSLRRSPTLLIWYEMYYGHRLLLGDPGWMANLPFADLRDVPAREFQALLVNRGTLLVINAWMLDQGKPLTSIQQRAFIKHMMKAVIGFGDAWLYFHGQYHWSYRERLYRICSSEAPEALRLGYQEAMQFRFKPFYENYVTRDFSAWLTHLLQLGSSVYQEVSFPVEPFSLYAFRNRWMGLLHPPKENIGDSFLSRLAFRLLSPRQRMASVFPIVAFGHGEEPTKQRVAAFLGSADHDPKALRRAYLQQWQHWGDSNFSQSLEEWGLPL